MKIKTMLLVGFAALVVVPTAAYTYVLLSPPRHWDVSGGPISICVISPGHASLTGDGGISTTIAAINGTSSITTGTEGWNVTAAGTVGTATTCTTGWALGDGIPTIAFTEKIAGTCGGSCLAATFTGYYSCPAGFDGGDGHCRIDDADVETRRNKADRKGGPYYDANEPCTSGAEWNMEAIMVHEVGHVLGIGHTDVGGATMYPSVSSCNTSAATIEADDAAALDALY
jgi:hypothetical protein